MKKKDGKFNKQRFKRRYRENKSCSIDEFQAYSHLTAISDELNHENKAITYGRGL